MTTNKMNIDTPWLTLREAVAYSRRGRAVVLAALKTGGLQRHQPVPGGSWTIHREAVDQWNRGEVSFVEPARLTRPQLKP